MPGAITSGNDPSGYSPTSFSIVGAMLAGLGDRDETNVRAQLTDEVQNNDTLTTMSSKVFAGINPQLGIVAGTIEAMLRQIIGSIPVIGPIADQWTEELLGQFGQYYTNLGSMLGSINFLDPDYDPQAAAAQFVNLMLLPLNIFMGPNSPINANNIFNLIPAQLLGFIPASSVGDAQVNLITNPDFEGDEPIESSVFTLDLDESFSAVGGSARVTADGTGAKDLLSPDLIRVSTGQKVAISAMVKWEGMTGTGTPIRVGITGYTAQGSAIIQPDLATHAVQTATDWIQLGGEFTINNTSVVSIRLRLTVGTSATAGTIWWDHVDLHKTNKIQTNLIADADGNGLPDILDDFQTNVTSILNQIPGFATVTQLFNLQDVLGGTFGSTITAIEENLANFLTPQSSIPGANVVGEIADEIVPGLISMLGSAVSGLLNLPTGNYGHAEVQQAFTHTADTMATLSAQVEELRLARGAGLTGGDEFERVASSAGADWVFDYSGGAGIMKVDGHNLYFDGSGTTQRNVKGLYLPLTLATDYQFWSVTLNSAPETADAILFNIPPILAGSPAYNDVLGRMNPARTDYIMFRVGHGMAYIYRVVNNIATELNSAPFPTPGPGSTLTLQCGAVGSNARYFKGMVNGQKAVEITEVGTASIVDASHRQGGLGGINASWLGAFRQSRMGSVKQFLGADQ